jgi:nucleoside permease NupC
MSRNKGLFAVLGGIIAGYATLLALYLYVYTVDTATVLAFFAIFCTLLSAFLILSEERRKQRSRRQSEEYCERSQSVL